MMSIKRGISVADTFGISVGGPVRPVPARVIRQYQQPYQSL
jgi:hypothetical protein